MQFRTHPAVDDDVEKVSTRFALPEQEVRDLIARWLVHLAKFGTSQDQWSRWELWTSESDRTLEGCLKVHAGVADTPLRPPFAGAGERPLRIVVEADGDDYVVLAVLPKYREKTIAGRRVREQWAYAEAGRRRLEPASVGSIGSRA